jgi:LysM repeat protein
MSTDPSTPAPAAPGPDATTDAARAEADPPEASSEASSVASSGLVAPPLVAADACPFLIAAAGAYRMSVPDREHRCAAFVPATSLAPSKQARLCLTANHLGCATYLASTSARQARTGHGERLERAGRWGLARTMPVIEEVGGLRATLGALIADRRTWPAIPAVLLATLLLALGLSSSWGTAPLTAVASPTATPKSQVSPRPTTAPTRTAGPGASEQPSLPAPSATPVPTPGASATPAPAFTTYKVRTGDTLYVIAQQFHTTVKAIQQLNGLSGTTLHIGQVLKIPKA